MNSPAQSGSHTKPHRVKQRFHGLNTSSEKLMNASKESKLHAKLSSMTTCAPHSPGNQGLDATVAVPIPSPCQSADKAYISGNHVLLGIDS